MPCATNDWENPSVFGVHKIRSHVPLRSYESIEQIFEYCTTLPDGSTSGRCQSLDGLWKFTLSSSPETVPDGYIDEEYDDTTWFNVRDELFVADVYPYTVWGKLMVD
jgi:beta-galactosidase